MVFFISLWSLNTKDMRSINKWKYFPGNNKLWVGGGRAELLPTHISPAESKAGLQLPSWPCSQAKPQRRLLPEVGKCPRTEARVLCSELGWTPRPTEHSICPTSLSRPFTMSLGDVSSLQSYGKDCNSKGPDQPFANIHYHMACGKCEMLVFARWCSEPDLSPGFILLGNALRCSGLPSTPGGGSGLRKAVQEQQSTGK